MEGYCAYIVLWSYFPLNQVDDFTRTCALLTHDEAVLTLDITLGEKNARAFQTFLSWLPGLDLVNLQHWLKIDKMTFLLQD